MNSQEDLIPEENDTVLLALKRLPPKEAYDRVYRLRRALQCSITHTILPKEQQTKPEEVSIFSCSTRQGIETEERNKRLAAPNVRDQVSG
jgi:ubiquinol-cytochrome c reductase subunit 7